MVRGGLCFSSGVVPTTVILPLFLMIKVCPSWEMIVKSANEISKVTLLDSLFSHSWDAANASLHLSLEGRLRAGWTMPDQGCVHLCLQSVDVMELQLLLHLWAFNWRLLSSPVLTRWSQITGWMCCYELSNPNASALIHSCPHTQTVERGKCWMMLLTLWLSW